MASRPPSRVSRIPSALPAAGSSTATTRSAAKRTASTAQLDPDIEHALTRRQVKVEAFSATMAKSTMERRVAEAEQAKKAAETEVARIKAEKVKVESDRRFFAEREKELEEDLQREREAFEEERVSV